MRFSMVTDARGQRIFSASLLIAEEKLSGCSESNEIAKSARFLSSVSKCLSMNGDNQRLSVYTVRDLP